VVSAVTVEHRGVDQLVAARFQAPQVTITGNGVEVSDDMSSIVHISLPTQYRVDVWKPIPLTLDLSSVCLFDLGTGSRLAATSAVSTTCRASTTSSRR
jgi:hypothetical protein